MMAMPIGVDSVAATAAESPQVAAPLGLRVLGAITTGLFAVRMVLLALLAVYFLLIAPDPRASGIALLAGAIAYLVAFGIGDGLRAGERRAAIGFLIYAGAMIALGGWMLLAFRYAFPAGFAPWQLAGPLIWPTGAWQNPWAIIFELIYVLAGVVLVGGARRHLRAN